MKQFQLLILILSLFSTTIFAQAPNDDCDGIIDLGVAPSCQTDVFYTNIGTTPSDIGFDNSPTCFNGGTTQRDVWFSFTTSDTIRDYTFTVTGVETGDNQTPIRNPQIALYRGSCEINGLAELLCSSAPNGENTVSLNALGLSSGITYFLRVNDYSATGAPNAGDFNICVEQLSTEINIGESSGSVSCSGTLYDSGGPDGNYGSAQNFIFTICPQEFNQCIVFDIKELALEDGFDFLNFYSGNDNNSNNLIASLTGVLLGNGFQVQSDAECVTIEFSSDALITDTGFELTWNCIADACGGSSISNPTVINNIPFSESSSTCGAAATFANSPCTDSEFLNGPEMVYAYEAPGGTCARIEVSGAVDDTGIAVYNGDPADPNTICVARSLSGLINSASLEEPGTYYIVIAHQYGCTDYNISIEDADCALSPALADALCNPLNGCVEDSGLPSQFVFEDGFQDIEIIPGLNGGCWIGVGLEPDFYWFTIQANASGKFGFIFESSDTPSDIDFNVWGPFTQEQVCENPEQVTAFVQINPPIRSSYSPDAVPTGLADIHPDTGEPVEDEFDCGSVFTPGAEGDNFVRTIDTQEGEVYVVLVNDWGNEIQSGGINVDFSPSSPDVLAPIPPEIVAGDAAICVGDSVQIQIESAVGTIRWLNNTESLSCDDCFDPFASPLESTTYRSVVDGVCTSDTIEVTVQVYNLEAGEDAEVCRGEMFELGTGEEYPDATYTWSADDGIELSCTDCPSPMVNTPNAGTFNITVALNASGCAMTDMVTITVRAEQAAVYEIKDDLQICIGDATDLMNTAPANQSYSWTSDPVGFTSGEPNPTVMPNQTTRYYVSVENGICPFPSMDSILVEASNPPVIEISNDIEICQGDTIQLGTTEAEFGVSYNWSGGADIFDNTDPQSLATPTTSGTYTLTAIRNGCVVTASFNVEVTPIDLQLMPEDTFFLCLGDTIAIEAQVTPVGNPISYAPQDGSFDALPAGGINAYPIDNTTYTFTTEFMGCTVMDSIYVKVDSLPFDLMIVPPDTTICEGQIVELVSTTYEPSDFPDIEFMWTPNEGQLSPDSLFNLVVNPTDSVIYNRISTLGGCVDTSIAVVNVNPVAEIMVTPENPEICSGESVQLMATSEEEINEYMWMPETGLSCTDCPNPVARPQQTITYMVQGTTDSGCPAMGQVTITVTPAPDYAFPAQRTLCIGESLTLNLRPSDEYSYTWTSSDNSLTSNDAAPTVSPNQTVTYMLTISDGNCEPVSDQFTVEVIEEGMITVEGETTACFGEELILTANTTAPGTVTWTENGAESTTDQYFVDTEALGGRTITYVYDVGPGCDLIPGSVDISIGIPFNIDSTSQSIPNPVPQGSDLDLRVYPEEGVDIPKENILWFTEVNGELIPLPDNAFDGTQASVNPVESTVYVVQITSASGCVQNVFIPIEVIIPMIQIPNVFTPNGDGVNDFFTPINAGVGTDLGLTEIQTFLVYNRWGQTVYNNENPDQGWDGMYNGNPAPSDVYAYRIVLISPDGTEDVRVGEVTLLR